MRNFTRMISDITYEVDKKPRLLKPGLQEILW